MSEYRINGFEQIKAFYSWVFANADKRVSPQHISLYLFLINQNNRNNWIEWFKCPYDLAMAGACIGNKKTYYTCLTDLERWGFIKYEKGMNEWKAPLIKIEVLKSTSTDTSTVPQSEPLPTTLLIPLPTTLPTHIYKLITDNLKLITDNIEEIVAIFSEKKDSVDYDNVVKLYHELCPKMRKVEKLGKQRSEFIHARFSEYGLSKITEVLRLAGESDFLNGKNDRLFMADLEWLMRPNNFIKVLEGKYQNRTSGVKMTY